MIIGRDLSIELGIDTKGSDLSITWDNAAIPWRDMDASTSDAYYGEEINKDLKMITNILDDNYSKADIDEFVQ